MVPQFDLDQRKATTGASTECALTAPGHWHTALKISLLRYMMSDCGEWLDTPQ
ncbi:hypothetical protein M3J09_009636 [Ascochyta lentis]